MAIKKVTSTLYDCVKLMLDSKATWEEISGYMKISLATIGRIKQSADYAEYQKITSTAMYLAQKNRKKQQEAKPEPVAPAPAPAPVVEDLKMPGGTVSAGYQLNRIYEMQKKQLEVLTLMNNRLMFIVDELTGAPGVKGGENH